MLFNLISLGVLCLFYQTQCLTLNMGFYFVLKTKANGFSRTQTSGLYSLEPTPKPDEGVHPHKSSGRLILLPKLLGKSWEDVEGAGDVNTGGKDGENNREGSRRKNTD